VREVKQLKYSTRLFGKIIQEFQMDGSEIINKGMKNN
jgi:hypothetical protein|tara:strand:+ start:683 stop:793 length:111 start_codon:yes stop_codon:yes gene_type:complete